MEALTVVLALVVQLVMGCESEGVCCCGQGVVVWRCSRIGRWC